MTWERRVFSEEIKHEAIKLERQLGASEASIAKDLGIGTNLLCHWCRDAAGEGHRMPVVARTSQARNTSACAVNWPRSRRSATS
jgi:transposase-like protein